MPKSRHRPQLHFSVTPWMSKKQKLSGVSGTEAAPCYEEVLIDLDSTRREGNNGQAPDPCLKETPSDLPGCVAKPRLREGVASEWMTKSSTKPSDIAKEIENKLKEGRLYRSEDSLCSNRIDGASSDATVAPETIEMRGQCHLVFLDSGHLTGRFIQDGSKNITFGMIGRELLSKSDCMRDDDWKLLRLTFVSFNPRREFTTFVEKKGGDSAVLTPVGSLQDDEKVGLSEGDKKLLQKEKRVQVWFGCSVIKCDSDAQAYVASWHPKLVGKDVLVNKGEMKIENMDMNFVGESEDDDGF